MSESTTGYTSSTTGDIVAQDNAEYARGRVVVITGGNCGLGLETAYVLASVGAEVYITCRSQASADKAIEELKVRCPEAKVKGMVLDLSLLDSVKKFATAFLELDIPLHILINNAGVMGCPKSETQDGLELQFGVNHIGHFYLTTLLLDKIKSSSPSRIVNLSSNGHYLHCPEEGIVFDDLSGAKHYDAWQRYGQSKLANILFTKELQNRLDTEGADVTVTALHPGAINTNLARHLSISTAFKLLLNPKVYRHIFSFKNVQQGVATTIFCALDPRVIKGGYYSDCNIEREEVNPHVHDSELAKKLWVVSEELVQSKLISTY